MFSNETFSIDTPENVAFGYDVAGIGSRFLAALVDNLIIFVTQVLVFIALLVTYRLLGSFDLESSGLTNWVIALVSLIMFAFYWGYYVLFEITWNGQTPGKRWVGLRVLRADGTTINLGESIIRNLLRLIDVLPAFYGVGIVVMFLNAQSRRLGDLVAGTLVVHERSSVSLKSLASAEAQAAKAYTTSVSPSAVSGLPIERLTNEDIRMIEEYLRRRSQLSNPAELADQILRAIGARMDTEIPLGGGNTSDDVLVAIIKAHHEQRAEKI
jgi:uncharacterized RDD family membrane protein YckC